jgi:aminoglycoside phosphotransferase family enzyme
MPNDGQDEKVAFLASPGVLGAPGERPELRETHMSWVFLTKDRAFKLKKPVRFPFLDFTSLAAREAACRAEVELNQELAPGVYLRLARLCATKSGAFELDGAGQTVDWLVVMRRLDEALMLDARVRAGAATEADMEKLADLLIDFYRRTQKDEISPDAYIARFRDQLALDREIILSPRFPIDHRRAARIMDQLGAVFAAVEPALRERAAEKRLVEGHGDLRPEHVWLGDPICIIDRLEFNRALRFLDPFDELSFLGMECAVAGAPWIAPLLIARAKAALPPAASDDLVAFYIALRASLRARLTLAHLLDIRPRQPAKWAPLAERYLDQAAAALSLPLPAGS